MHDFDVSTGIKKELYEEVVATLDGTDRDVVKEYAPSDITLYQRTNGRGMFSHDARYLWMRLFRQTDKKDFGSTMHESSRCTVVREDAVLEAISHLREQQRLRLLVTAERDFQRQQKKQSDLPFPLPQLLSEMEWNRFQTLKDLLIRGRVELNNVCLESQTDNAFFTTADMEAFDTIAECTLQEEGEEEEPDSSDSLDQKADVFEGEDEEKRLLGLLFESWKQAASPEEAQLLEGHRSDCMGAGLEPYIKKRFLPRFGISVRMESELQQDSQGERLWYDDHHIARTKFDRAGFAFGKEAIRRIGQPDRAHLIDLLLNHFREECRFQCAYLSERIPIVRRYQWARAMSRPLWERLQACLLRAGEKECTLLGQDE